MGLALSKYGLTVLFCLLMAISAFSRPLTDYDAVVNRDPLGRSLPTRVDYLNMFPERDFNYQVINSLLPPRDENGTVVMIVNSELHSELEDRFDVWVEDLENDGYQIVRIVGEGGSPQEMKDLFIEEGGDDLVGCIFAGELPLAWFEHHDHFYDENEPDNQRLAEYPLDLFYMDIDGVWEDTTGNGIYDHHYGDVDPEIWIGSLPAYNLSRIPEVPFVADYLDRIHAYREGEIELSHRALNYIDDDWTYLEPRWSSDLGNIYGMVVGENRPDTTSAAGYVRHLEEDSYEYVQVGVHSTSDSHAFWVNGRRDRDYFRFFHLRDDVELNAPFYNLFACSSMNMSGRHNLCMGVLYAMGGPNHLGAVGPTKTGSMLFFEDYYRPLAEGKNFGEALRLWMVEHAHDNNRPNWARSWFYGMVHYGDPTLKIKQGLRAGDTAYLDEDGDGDFVPDAGETVELMFRLSNRGEVNLNNIELTVTTIDTNAVLINDQVQIDAVTAGDEISVEGISVELANHVFDKDNISLNISMIPEDGDRWFENIIIPVRAPRLEVTGFAWTETEGDGNNFVENGEEGVLSIQIRNQGGDDMHSEGEIEVLSLDENFNFDEEFGRVPDLIPNGVGSMDPVGYSITGAADGQTTTFLHVKCWVEGVLRGEGIIAMPIDSDFQIDERLDQDPVWMRQYAVTLGYHDGWHWLAEDGEDGGAIAFGGPDSAKYQATSDAAFELPLMMYAENAVLVIRHRADIEPEFDAAVIEVDRGEGWYKASPLGGYNGISVPNGDYEGGECWNGAFDWQTDRVNLGRTSGPLRVRFRFSADEGVEGNGWFIDRIEIEGEPLALLSKLPVLYDFQINDAFPNPFNHRFSITYTLPQAGIVSTTVYNIRGEKVNDVVKSIGSAGVNHLSISAVDLPSGIYLVSLSFAGNSLQAKAVLVR